MQNYPSTNNTKNWYKHYVDSQKRPSFEEEQNGTKIKS